MTSDSTPDWIASLPWAEGTVVLFGFAWGAMLGSFVNVVAHRLPLGRSVVVHRSRCPRCGAAIRPTDNVPILGWLLLGGRCRACGEAIAASYPLVELGCGLVAATLAATHLAGGGRWLPRMEHGFPGGIDRLLRGDWRPLVACGLHASVVLTIVAWSLLDRRGWFVPGRSLWGPLLACLAAVAAVPEVGPPGPLPDGSDWPTAPAWLAATVASSVGATAGWLAGRLASARAVRLGMPLLGSLVGWQAVTVVAVVTAGCAWAGTRRSPGLPGLLLAVLATVLLAFHGLLRLAVATPFALAGQL